MNQKMSMSEAGKLGAKASIETTKRLVQERIKEYNKNPKLCGHCKLVIPYGSDGKKYCSRQCFYLDNKQKIAELNTKHGRFKTKPCKVCGTDTKRKFFCSHKCRGEFQKNATFERAGNGEPTRRTREFLVELRGHQCEDCKNKEWKCQPIILTVHHIDGDATNNSPDNLQLLCSNCHAMTPNYGSKNKNSTRIKRRNAYVPVIGNGPVS